MTVSTLEELIRQYVPIPPTPSATGWYPVLHTACDHGRKGPRAAFKFEGETVGFNCFNCPLTATFNPNDSNSNKPLISKNMIQALTDFGVPEAEIKALEFEMFQHRNPGQKQVSNETIKSIEPQIIELPSIFYRLDTAPENDSWKIIADDYLSYKRGIDPNSYPFYLSRKSSDVHLKKWHGRVIIPIYKDSRLIFYIGRDLTGKKLKKYETPSVSRDSLLFGFDRLFKDYEHPLYIVEGWFDAFAIDGVAIIGNRLSDAKIEWLNRSPRKKVYIPDRYGDGIRGGKEAIEAGWHISTPKIGDCKDMSEAVQKYGKLYVLKALADATSHGMAAEKNLGLFCEK